MKQVFQDLKNGRTSVVDVPTPKVKRGEILIRTSKSLISVGTEKMLVDFGKANIFNKALQQPDKVRMALEKIKTDGVLPTFETVFNKLNEPLPLGYCNVGKIIGLGSPDLPFYIGQRVVSNGYHSEIVSVSENLCASVPENVKDSDAVFTVLSSIALQGIRLIDPNIGETIVVTGLGLVGLLTVQILKANGCKVIGVDTDTKRLELAKNFGALTFDLTSATNLVDFINAQTGNKGADGVIIAASTKSSKPLKQAAQITRQRGKIVLVGVVGLNIERDDFFKKEITFQVSASYGPGRYDSDYEDRGLDYPFGFVRWTAKRNFEAILQLMDENKLDLKPLISHNFGISSAHKAYDILASNSPTLGVIINYENQTSRVLKSKIKLTSAKKQIKGEIYKNKQISFVGAGNYAKSKLIPAFQKHNVKFQIISSQSGKSSLFLGKKFKFEEATTDTERIFSDTKTNAVVISTRHDSHSQLVLKGLKNGKSIFVEKPLCLNLKDLNKIEKEYKKQNSDNSKQVLMVGFNRRFAPHIIKIKSLIDNISQPFCYVMTVNAGHLSTDHWLNDIEIGGGRLIGEAIHFIDLLRFLSGSPIEDYSLNRMNKIDRENFTINLNFSNGSLGIIHYFSNGSKLFPKEKLEIFGSGKILQLDNFKKLKAYGFDNFSRMNLWRQDKGQSLCVKSFISSLSDRNIDPIPPEEIFEVNKVAIELSAD